MRARNLKPSIFKNEHLAVADPLYTVIFEGLWCLADREGRLEDRPAKIHFDVNPGRAFEGTELALRWLQEHDFIKRYEVDGVRCIWVPTFAEHQRPHINETASKLPPYQPRHVAAPTMVGASTDQGDKHSALNPSSLNPESPFLNPHTRASGSTHARAVLSEEDTRNQMGFLKLNYPEFSGRPDWIGAEHHIRLMIERGETTWVDLHSAVVRYQSYCLNGGVSSTRYVLTPIKFFTDRDRPWTLPWNLPVKIDTKPKWTPPRSADEIEAEEAERERQRQT